MAAMAIGGTGATIGGGIAITLRESNVLLGVTGIGVGGRVDQSLIVSGEPDEAVS